MKSLKINGQWKIVVLDDYFPCYSDTKKPVFAKPFGSELWVMLMEKAWAKVNGGYYNIVDGCATEVIAAFTNFPREIIFHSDYMRNKKHDVFKLQMFEDRYKRGEVRMLEAHFIELRTKKIFEALKNSCRNLINKLKEYKYTEKLLNEKIEMLRSDREYKVHLENLYNRERDFDFEYINNFTCKKNGIRDDDFEIINYESNYDDKNDDKYKINITNSDKNFLTFGKPGDNRNANGLLMLNLKAKSEIAFRNLISFDELKRNNLFNTYIKKSSLPQLSNKSETINSYFIIEAESENNKLQSCPNTITNNKSSPIQESNSIDTLSVIWNPL